MTKLAIYDLSYCPITFDFIHFLASARLFFAHKSGDTSFDLLIIASNFRDISPRDKCYSDSQKSWRIHNLLLPIIACSPFVRSFSVLLTRPSTLPPANYLYPPDYNLSSMHSPIYYFGSSIRHLYLSSSSKLHPACFQAPPEAIHHARSLLNCSSKLVLFSPRFSSFEPSRNTNLSLIKPLVGFFENEGFHTCFVHDQEDYGQNSSLNDVFSSSIHLPEASFNIPLRLALFEIANVNIFTPCALMGFAQLSKRLPNLVCFDMYKDANSSHTGTDDDYTNRGGMTTGQTFPYPWSTQNMRFIWEREPPLDLIFSHALSVSKYPRRFK